MYHYHVAIIDDNKAVCQSLKLVLDGVFASVITLPHPNALPALLASGKTDVILLDMNFDPQKLTGEEGITWLKYIKEQPNPPAVVLITAFGDISLAVNALKEGAEDFITKPWENEVLIEKLIAAIKKRAENRLADQKVQKAEYYIGKQEQTRQMTLEEMEKQHILDILSECENNVKEVAVRLGISRQTLYNKMKKYGLTQ